LIKSKTLLEIYTENFPYKFYIEDISTVVRVAVCLDLKLLNIFESL